MRPCARGAAARPCCVCSIPLTKFDWELQVYEWESVVGDGNVIHNFSDSDPSKFSYDAWSEQEPRIVYNDYPRWHGYDGHYPSRGAEYVMDVYDRPPLSYRW